MKSKRALRVGCIDYLNSVPFYYGMDAFNCDLTYGSPSELTRLFCAGEIDAGLLPIGGFMGREQNFDYIGTLGIAAKQRAISVVLFANSPLDNRGDISIWVTDQSVTSRKLLQVLCDDWWRFENVRYVESELDCDAKLLIGDAALREINSNGYARKYDLAQVWRQLTGLPFVFARWMVNADVDEQTKREFERNLNLNFSRNMSDLDALVAALRLKNFGRAEIAAYLGNFTYRLDAECLRGADEFKRRLRQTAETAL